MKAIALTLTATLIRAATLPVMPLLANFSGFSKLGPTPTGI